MVFPLWFVCQESNFLFLSCCELVEVGIDGGWGRMRGWFASGLTKHVFTITPFIMPCLCKTVFFGTHPRSLDLASKKAETDSLRNTLSITARATKLSNG